MTHFAFSRFFRFAASSALVVGAILFCSNAWAGALETIVRDFSPVSGCVCLFNHEKQKGPEKVVSHIRAGLILFVFCRIFKSEGSAAPPNLRCEDEMIWTHNFL